MVNRSESREEYLTVGEMARKMHVSVRTLQYYDREGLLTPSALSDGGRRLYTYKDMVTLHQILSLKHLGFSLAEIKEKLLPLENPCDVAAVLREQADAVRAQIATLSETLANLEKLRDEVLSMEEVDFRCYADIVTNLEMRNDLYWVIKHLDRSTRDQIRSQFDQERGSAFLDQFRALQDEAVHLKQSGQGAGSPEAQRLAERFWTQVLQFTQSDPAMMGKLLALHEDTSFSGAWEKLEQAQFLEEALGIYLERSGINPFGGGEND